METYRENSRLQRTPRGHFPSLSTSSFALAPLILAMAFAWPFGHGKTVDMMAGTTTPAAHGRVIYKSGPNGNVELDVKTAALAKPSALTPAENVYVVWLQEPGKDPQNLGELRVDKNLNGDLHTVTPFKRFKVFITAEQNAQEQQPSGIQVLSADVSGSAA